MAFTMIGVSTRLIVNLLVDWAILQNKEDAKSGSKVDLVAQATRHSVTVKTFGITTVLIAGAEVEPISRSDADKMTEISILRISLVTSSVSSDRYLQYFPSLCPFPCSYFQCENVTVYYNKQALLQIFLLCVR